MKKVAIMTFHKAHNYGAVLQAFALSKTIARLGYDVSFADLQHEKISEGYRLVPSTSGNSTLSIIKGYVHFFLDPFNKTKRSKGFNNFIKNNFKLLEVNSNIPKLVDTIVLGSDQIWNPEYTNGFVDFHFGKISGLESQKVISYAASMGKTTLGNEDREQFYKYLVDMDSIGVREESLQNLLIDEFNINSSLNLDPTLLLDYKDWQELAKPMDRDLDDYLLVYEVQSNDLTSFAIEQISKALDLKVVYLAAKANFRIPSEHISDASPEQFLHLFSKAKFIITTSFHGTVFSIINNLPFVTVGFGNDIDARSASLLKTLGLNDRIVFTESEVIALKDSLDVPYEDANKNLKELKESSVKYLGTAISGK